MSYDYSQSGYFNTFLDEVTDRVLQIKPEWEGYDVRDAIEELLVDDLQNPLVVLDNNYVHETKNASMLSVIDWAEETRPLIAGNGTFYKNQHEALNPIANMLVGMLTRRKAFKKEMFKIEDANSKAYKDLDLKQSNEKVNCNS